MADSCCLIAEFTKAWLPVLLTRGTFAPAPSRAVPRATPAVLVLLMGLSALTLPAEAWGAGAWSVETEESLQELSLRFGQPGVAAEVWRLTRQRFYEDKKGRTVLSYAAAEGNTVLIHEILAAPSRRWAWVAKTARDGVSVARLVADRDNQGWTALHHAARNDRTMAAALLLDAGASPTTRAQDGLRPGDIAAVYSAPSATLIAARANHIDSWRRSFVSPALLSIWAHLWLIARWAYRELCIHKAIWAQVKSATPGFDTKTEFKRFRQTNAYWEARAEVRNGRFDLSRKVVNKYCRKEVQ